MSERDAREELAIANRILVDQGVVDAFGHVSVRHPARADRFLLARNMAPASVTPDDILEFDLDGEAVDPRAPRPYLERFIHGEVLRARPDVMSVVHSHSPAVIPFSVAQGVSLRAVSHMGSFLGVQTPRESVFRAVYTEFNARIELEARGLGPVTFLTAGEAAASAATNASQVDRAWNVWKERAS